MSQSNKTTPKEIEVCPANVKMWKKNFPTDETRKTELFTKQNASREEEKEKSISLWIDVGENLRGIRGQAEGRRGDKV